MTVDMIFDILKDSKSAEETGLYDWEIGYYESILNDKENLIIKCKIMKIILRKLMII